MLALRRFLRLLVLDRSRLPLLPDQGYQDLTEWKLVSDGLDNVLQFIFATSKGTFFVARRNGAIERFIPDQLPREALFQKPIFVGPQNKKASRTRWAIPTTELIGSQENSKPRAGSHGRHVNGVSVCTLITLWKVRAVGFGLNK